METESKSGAEARRGFHDLLCSKGPPSKIIHGPAILLRGRSSLQKADGSFSSLCPAVPGASKT